MEKNICSLKIFFLNKIRKKSNFYYYFGSKHYKFLILIWIIIFQHKKHNMNNFHVVSWNG